MESRAQLAIALAAASAALGAPASLAQTTERVSVSSSGAQGTSSSAFFVRSMSISADGRFVAFDSWASNFVAGDTSLSLDVFVRDRQSGTTECVNVAPSGAVGVLDSQRPSIAANGQWVAFESGRPDLVAGDLNNAPDIFVRDRVNATTERVSVATAGTEADNWSLAPAMSADGRCVTFESYATNLVAVDVNGHIDVFVRDRQSGTTELASVSTGGVQGNADCTWCGISGDGGIVVFQSTADNLVAGDVNGIADVFVRDRASGTTQRVSVSTGGAEADHASSRPAISSNARFVAFESYATNLVVGDTNGTADVFVRDRQFGTTARVSISSSGAQGNQVSLQASLSGDGRFVSFFSFASNLVANDTNSTSDVFVYDRLLGLTERASVDADGVEANNSSVCASISADARCVAFRSDASNLVAGDTNGVSDAYVRERWTVPASYCTPGTSSNGCNASISVSANPSVSHANTCFVAIAGVDGRKSGLFFYGIDNSGFAPLPWASGSTSYLCVKPPTQRTPMQNSGGTSGACDGAYVLDWNAYQATNPLALGSPWSAGATVYVQAWFRDPPAAKTTNLSDALAMTYVP